MLQLEPPSFPSPNLGCYEAALIMLLKYVGLSDETLLMGTQAYFVFYQDEPGILPRFNQIHEEWERVYGLTTKNLPVVDANSLHDEIIARIDDRTPICLPLDLYYLPYTPHYEHLHQIHFVDVFGYDPDHYYIVCPYYRFSGWVDKNDIHRSFFALTGGRSRNIFLMPAATSIDLSVENAHNLVRENCQNMLGLMVPDVLSGLSPDYLGVAGIKTFATFLRQSMHDQTVPISSDHLLDLSRHLISIGNSRYWFHKLLEQYQSFLFSDDVATNLQEQFSENIRSWRGMGKILGASVHTHKPEKVKSVVLYLENIYAHEKQLFSTLLGALPDYEAGIL